MPFAELSADGGASWQQVRFGSPGPDPVITALAPSGSGVTGIDSVETQAGQQFVILP